MSDNNHIKSSIKVTNAATGSTIIGTKIDELRGDLVHGDKVVYQTIIRKAAPKPLITTPYKFLSYYDISDKDLFFGREEMVRQIAGLIPQHKALIINGEPGSGKSSLVNAGLIPFLAEEHDYAYLSFREYSRPVEQLVELAVQKGFIESARGV